MFLDGKETKATRSWSVKELSMAVQSEVPMALGVVLTGEGLNVSLASSSSQRMRGWCHFESVTVITPPNYC